MKKLLVLLLLYNYFLLFVLLEVIFFILLFRFNSYQGSVFFTSAHAVAGSVCEISSQVARYWGLEEVNRRLTARNVELEMEMEAFRRAVNGYAQNSMVVRSLLDQGYDSS